MQLGIGHGEQLIRHPFGYCGPLERHGIELHEQVVGHWILFHEQPVQPVFRFQVQLIELGTVQNGHVRTLFEDPHQQ